MGEDREEDEMEGCDGRLDAGLASDGSFSNQVCCNENYSQSPY